MQKKNLLTLILSLVGVVVLCLAIYFISSSFKSNSDGEITVIVEMLDGTVEKEKTIEFNEGDELVTLISENFDNVVFDNGMIMAIESYTTPSDWSTFLCVYVDGNMSMVGLSEIEFTDGTEIKLVVTEFIYE